MSTYCNHLCAMLYWNTHHSSVVPDECSQYLVKVFSEVICTNFTCHHGIPSADNKKKIPSARFLYRYNKRLLTFSHFNFTESSATVFAAVPGHDWPAKPKSEQQRDQNWRSQREEDMQKDECIIMSYMRHLHLSFTQSICGLFATPLAAMRYICYLSFIGCCTLVIWHRQSWSFSWLSEFRISSDHH